MCVVVAFLLVALSGAQASTDAESFRSYEQERFYLYSQSEKAEFACRMQLDSVDALVAGLKAKIASGALPMDLKDSLEGFGVKYSRATDSLEFTRPTLALAIKEGAEIASQARLQVGMTQIFMGFNAQVEGAIGIAQGLLHEFLLSRHDAIQDVEFEATKSGYRATFSMEGGTTTTDFDGATKHSEIRIGSGSIKAKAHFASAPDGKLVLAHAEMVPAPGSSMTMVLNTQVLDGFILPEFIDMKASQASASGQSDSGLVINFTNCSVK